MERIWGGSETCRSEVWVQAPPQPLDLSLPNKTWFHISLPVSPLPFPLLWFHHP